MRMLAKDRNERFATPADVIAAVNDGVDYVTLSPFFPTASKPDYRSDLDRATLNRIVTEAALPVLALGGITLETLSELRGSAVRGIAIMGEAMRTPDPEAWFGEIAERFLEKGG